MNTILLWATSKKKLTEGLLNVTSKNISCEIMTSSNVAFLWWIL